MATAEDYLIQLQELLPEGAAWSRERDAVLSQILLGLAEELARVDARANELLDEADPRVTFELLADWERVAGLPDDCAPADETTQQRQRSLVQKLTTMGGQSRAFFIELALKLGYPGAQIVEFRPLTCIGECTGSLDPDPWRFVWRLDLPQETLMNELGCDGTCVEPLRSWGDALLECVISRLKPAHTKVTFAYGVV